MYILVIHSYNEKPDSWAFIHLIKWLSMKWSWSKSISNLSFLIALLTMLRCTAERACLLSCFSHVQFFASLWNVAHQAPLFMGFSRQVYWSGLPCPLPGYIPIQGSNSYHLCFLNFRRILYPLSRCGRWIGP